MPKKSPVAGIALGVVGLAALAYVISSPSTATAGTTGKKPLPGGTNPSLPGPKPVPAPTPIPTPSGQCQLDDNIDPTLRAQIVSALNATNLTPADYEQTAVMADQANLPKAAACLRQKEAQVQAQQQAIINARGGWPFTIRMGDIPSGLAAYYTGNGARFHELEALNPQLGSIQTVNGVSNYYSASGQPTWVPGAQILIPASWNPLSRPLPPVAPGGGPAPAPTPSGSVAGTTPDASGIWGDILSALSGQSVAPTGGA